MKPHIRRSNRASRAAAFSSAAAVVVALLAAPPALAQSAQQRRDERRADMEARQRALRTLSDDLKKREKKKDTDTRPTYQQVAEDFEQLQLRNYNLSVSAAPGGELDYARIGEEAAEVRRRAARLKSSLALPAVKDDGRKKKDGALAPDALKSAIASLDALVKSFVWNPVFRRPDVLDAENSSKASRELEEILRLSERIRKSAEVLGEGKNL